MIQPEEGGRRSVDAPSGRDSGRDSGGDERLSREARLRRGRDYQHCYRRGRRRTGAHLILYFASNGLDQPRLGTTLSRKVGNSVVRHRIKRRLREIYRRCDLRSSLPAVDLVVHVKPGAAGLSFEQLRSELLGLLVGVEAGGRRRRR